MKDMMFSSNQVLEISGCLSHEGELENALKFGMIFSGEIEYLTRQKDPAKLIYQIAGNKYCIGTCYSKIPNGWEAYSFDFDVDIVSRIIIQFLNKFEKLTDFWDGSYEKGFLMKCIPECLGDELNGIKEPFYGLLSFEPFTCFYSK